MPSGAVTEEISASSAEVFALLHDYSRRLEWDTLLRTAYLETGSVAGINATSFCAAKWHSGGIGVRARYVTFRPGELAAVEMINQPPFFETFAASIRHQALSPERSSITYRFTFVAKPRWLRFVLHPVMKMILMAETTKRLAGLKRYIERTKTSKALG